MGILEQALGPGGSERLIMAAIIVAVALAWLWIIRRNNKTRQENPQSEDPEDDLP